MKIAIKPVQLFVPGKGLVTATHLEVSVTNYQLGERAGANYELQAEAPGVPLQPANAPDSARPIAGQTKPTYQALSNGRADLTPEQFAAWGTDDTYFAKAIAGNAGLTPA